MQLVKKYYILCLALAATTFFVSCSEDNDAPSGSGSGSGGSGGSGQIEEAEYKVDFSVSGDFEAEKSGMAYFERDTFFSDYDFLTISCMDLDPNTFFFEIEAVITDGESEITVGTYPVGGDLSGTAEQTFHVLYDEYPAGGEYLEYESDVFEQSGTITIDVINKKEIRGSFDITVYSYDEEGNSTGEIKLVGNFSAGPNE